MKNYIKLFLLFMLAAASGIFVEFQRVGYLNGDISKYFIDSSEVVISAEPTYAKKVPENIAKDKTLIIYDSTVDALVEDVDQFKLNLDYLKEDYEQISIHEINMSPYYIEYQKYTNIILAVNNLESKFTRSQLNRIVQYAENGGHLFITVALGEHTEAYDDIYSKFGIKEIDGYKDIDGIKLTKEILPNATGRSFVSASYFYDTCVNVKLKDDVDVYMESAGENEGVPLLWETKLGSGKVVMYNGTAMGAPFYGGIFAGVYSFMHEDYIYPVINAKVIYIDDFPAPQYDIDYELINKVYNRSITEFYRDIWWPDMQGVAKKYDYKYTGLFISTYNNEVNPVNFVYEEFDYFQYYGNSLIKNNYEVGLHGYNHQSLALKDFVPDYIGYKPWGSQGDMEESMKFLENYAKELFPGIKFTSYVPPSNFLSPEGRSALANALPDLKIISGLYYDETDEKKSYVQKFEIADDGIAEFPRMTSGMWKDEQVEFVYLNGLALHGVFSHFIHPDDVIDEERGRGALWDELIKGFGEILKDVDKTYPEIRALKSTDAADALKVYDKLEVLLDYSDDKIDGYCNNFYGQAFFYLRTEKTPSIDSKVGEIEKLGDDDYYFVTVNNATFSIELK